MAASTKEQSSSTIVPATEKLLVPSQNASLQEDDSNMETPIGRPERTATFRDYTRVFRYATKWDFFAYAAGFIASIGAGVTLPLMNVIFGKFVGNFNGLSTGTINPESFKPILNHLSLYMFALFVCRLALNYINKLTFRMIGIRVSSAIRLAYLQSLFAQSIHVLDSLPPGYATTTITSTSNTLQLGISERLGVFIEYNATIISAIVIAFIRSWELTLVTASAILFILFTVSLIMPSIVKIQGKTSKAESKAAAVASESMASLRMVAACGAESRMSQKYAKFVGEINQHARSNSPFISIQFGLVFFAVYSAFGLAFWYGTKMHVEGRMPDIGTIVVVLFSVMIVLSSLERVSTPLLAVSNATVAACQFFTVIDAPRPDPGHLEEPDVTAADDITLERVTFAYPSRPHVKILDNLDLRIERGKITAIVGPSGSGKSTIVGLIERWYNLKDQRVLEKAVEKKRKNSEESNSDAERYQEEQAILDRSLVTLAGSVNTCGHSLDDINIKWWRSQIGLVQQEPFLFNDTILKNVANGLVGTKWENESDEKKYYMVQDACKEAFADEFIEKLPQGYQTLVGDNGAKLSGGQRQRLAIARAIIRKPKILILDEATSAIDVRGERIVQAALDQVAKNRTTITIAHRLSTIQKADRIVVLKKGKVVESGTHESLLANVDGVYTCLVNAQALSLGEPTDADEALHREADDAELTKVTTTAQSVSENETKQEDEIMRGFFDSFGRLFYETRSYWGMMFLTIIFAAIGAAGTPLQAWLFAKVTVIFGEYGSNPDQLLNQSNYLAKMWVTLAAGVGIGYFGTYFSSTRTAAAIRAKYQAQYFDDILHQKPAFFDDEQHSQGTMVSRASRDPQQLEELMGANMASAYMGIFSLMGSVAIAFSFGWKLALVALCIIMPILLGCSYWRLRYEIVFNKMNDEVFAESSTFASEAISAFRTVASLTLEDAICTRFEDLCNDHVVTAYNKARWASLLFAFSDSATLACQALIFYYGGRLLLHREYGVESFFVIYMAVMNAGEATGQSLSFGPNAAQVKAAANRILNMHGSRLKDSVSSGESIPDAVGGVRIELDNIRFTYPTRETPVFEGLSLTIKKGQFAALVGASGCGKTSIISLLERFYTPDSGRILCNGRDIAKTNVYQYRKQLSLVAQEATLFQGTLRENIFLGVDESSITDEQLHQACRDASIHDFIVSLPEGYATNIGSKGVTLSGGQKQRIAIARALIRKPDLLLLDEATSSLDSESEKLVQVAFERAAKGRTMVAVAHRLATVQNADVIFVLGEGKLLEQGSHRELLKKKGVYWQMCQNQALDR